MIEILSIDWVQPIANEYIGLQRSGFFSFFFTEKTDCTLQ